jgi:hypothetical protein
LLGDASDQAGSSFYALKHLEGVFSYKVWVISFEWLNLGTAPSHWTTRLLIRIPYMPSKNESRFSYHFPVVFLRHRLHCSLGQFWQNLILSQLKGPDPQLHYKSSVISDELGQRLSYVHSSKRPPAGALTGALTGPSFSDVATDSKASKLRLFVDARARVADRARRGHCNKLYGVPIHLEPCARYSLSELCEQANR